MTIEIHCFPYYIHLPIPIGKKLNTAKQNEKWKLVNFLRKMLFVGLSLLLTY